MDNLEQLGNLLQQAQEEFEQLPNQYTKGKLDAVVALYKAEVSSLSQPNLTQNPLGVYNLQNQQMQKYGVPDQTVDMLRNVQQYQGNVQSKHDPVLEAVETTNNLLVDILDVLRANNKNISYEAEKAFRIQQEHKILEDVQKEQPKHHWNQSFGQRMQGQTPPQTGYEQTNRNPQHPSNQPQAPYGSNERFAQIQQEQKQRHPNEDEYQAPPEENYIDPETGYQGVVRKIGNSINIDDDTPQTVEQWNQQGQRPQVYMARPNDNELEDLGPGQ